MTPLSPGALQFLKQLNIQHQRRDRSNSAFIRALENRGYCVVQQPYRAWNDYAIITDEGRKALAIR